MIRCRHYIFWRRRTRAEQHKLKANRATELGSGTEASAVAMFDPLMAVEMRSFLQEKLESQTTLHQDVENTSLQYLTSFLMPYV